MKLQNNNREPVKPNGARVPQDAPFIEMNKTLKTPYQNLFSGFSQVGSDATGKLANIIEQYNSKSQQIQATNQQNDYLIDYSNLTKRYKDEYSRNPTESVTKKYNQDLQRLKDSYIKNIPNEYQNNFLHNLNNIEKQNDLDFFRSQANLQHQMKLYQQKLNDNLQNFKERITAGDDGALTEQIATQNILKNQLTNIYGIDNGNKIFKQYQQQVTDAFLSSKLSQRKSQELFEAIKIIETTNLKHTIDPIRLKKYKLQADGLKKKEKRNNKIQQQINNIANSNSIFGAIINGELNDYSDIISALDNLETSDRNKKLLLKIAGYDDKYFLDGDKPTKTTGKKASTTNIETYGDLQKEILLLADFDSKEISKKENQQQLQDLFDKIDNYRYDIGLLLQKKQINLSEANNLLAQLDQYTANLQTAKLDNLEGGWWIFNKNDSIKQLKNIEEQVTNNIFRGEQPKNKSDLEIKDKIQNAVYGGFFDRANKIFLDAKQRNPEIQVNNWMDYRQQILNKKQRDIFDKMAMATATENLLEALNYPLPVEKEIYDKYSVEQKQLLLQQHLNQIEVIESEKDIAEFINN